ncbi:MAG: DUF4019 domain-containing protein [Gemmatimonadales bacterium]
MRRCVSAVVAGVAIAACRGGGGSERPASVTLAEFRSLAWLEGSWVGKEPDGNSFYEKYRFKDDSTMGTWAFADSAATAASDSGEVRLRGGQVTSGNDLLAWVVTAFDYGQVRFSPLHGARNSFTWSRGSGGGWVASLHWPADGTQPARDVVYQMEPRSPAQAHAADSLAALVAAAESVAKGWLELMDRRKYGESWNGAASFLRSAVTRKAWVETIPKARSPFEPFGSRALMAASFQTKIPGVPPGEYVVIQYRTRDGHGKTVVETVTPMKDTDGQWRVSGYYIRPE